MYLTLDLALRVGDLLLANGAGAGDVHQGMKSVLRSCGLSTATPSITFTELSISYQPHIDEPAIIQTREVHHREVDHDDLTKVDHILRDLVGGRIDRDEARRRVLDAVASGHLRPRWAVTLGWGVMATGVALLIGGSALVSGLAFLCAVAIDRVTLWMGERLYPAFYLQVAGGLVATLAAVLVAALEIPVEPSRVVTAGIVMLLAGLGLVGATQDALIGYPLTATARFLEVTVSTIGIIAGVSGGLMVGRMLGVELGYLEPAVFAITTLPQMILGAGLTAAGFAYASYGRKRTLLPIALVGMLGMGVLTAVRLAGVDTLWATALAAVAVGMVSWTASGRFRVPPLAVVVSGLVPLLPGFGLYRGLALISEGRDGAGAVVTAVATALAIAAGAILGQYIAQPVRAEARRLETRLRSPRLVGSNRLPRRSRH